MQTRNRLFDDIARVANGAVSTLNGMKSEIETLIRQRVERIMADADMVPRDEFEAVKAMAAEARRQNDALEQRIAALENLQKAARPPSRSPAGSRTKPRRKTSPIAKGT